MKYLAAFLLGFSLPQLVAQNLIQTITDPCGNLTGVHYDENTCVLHYHCAISGLNFVRDTSGANLSNYTPYPGGFFSQAGMSYSPGGNMYMLRDIDPGAFGPGVELWEVNLNTSVATLALDLDPITTWEPFGLTINPGNGNLIIGETYNTGNIMYITEITPAGVFVDTLVNRFRMDSLGLSAGQGGLDIDPVSGNLVFGMWAGPNAGNLYALNFNTRALSLFYNTGLTAPDGPTGLSFTSIGDFVMTTSADIRFFDVNGDGELACFSSVLDVDFLTLNAEKEARQIHLRWNSQGNFERLLLRHSTDGMSWALLEEGLQAFGTFYHQSPTPGMHYYQLIGMNAELLQYQSNIVQVEFQEEEANLVIFPNPFEDALSLEGIAFDEKKVVEIWDSSGRKLRQEMVQGPTNLNLSDLPIGIYFVRCAGYTLKKVLKISAP